MAGIAPGAVGELELVARVAVDRRLEGLRGALGVALPGIGRAEVDQQRRIVGIGLQPRLDRADRSVGAARRRCPRRRRRAVRSSVGSAPGVEVSCAAAASAARTRVADMAISQSFVRWEENAPARLICNKNETLS